MFAQELGTECIHVLLVEDSSKEARITRRELQEIDDEFIIDRVSTLKEARERIRKTKIDVVVLDLGLPDSSGPDSVNILTGQFPELPVVILSGQSNAIAMAKALKHGVQEYLLKGECSGKMVRQAILSAMFRKSMEKDRINVTVPTT